MLLISCGKYIAFSRKDRIVHLDNLRAISFFLPIIESVDTIGR